jgi:hypothetical protein
MKYTEGKMFLAIYRTGIPILVLIIFSLQTIISSPEGYAQGLMKTDDFPGGGGGSTSSSEDTGGGSATLLIVGGVIIAGLLFYKLVINKDEPKKEGKQDSTSDQSLLLRNDETIASNILSENLKKMQELPVNLYLGFQKVDPALPERKFIMGITYNF